MQGIVMEASVTGVKGEKHKSFAYDLRLHGAGCLVLQRSRTWVCEKRGTVCARPRGIRLRLRAWLAQVFTEQNMEFMEKIIERSGLGDETGLSDGILAMRDPGAAMSTSLKAASEETQMVIFEVAGDLLKKANVRPDQARIRAARCI